MQISIFTILKFFAMTTGVLAVIYIALMLTPKIAKYIDDFSKKYDEKHPKPQEDERLYLVRGPFDSNHQLDMDKLYEQEKARRELYTSKNTSNNDDENTLIDNGDVNDNG